MFRMSLQAFVKPGDSHCGVNIGGAERPDSRIRFAGALAVTRKPAVTIATHDNGMEGRANTATRT
jgi:hypothetical protein